MALAITIAAAAISPSAVKLTATGSGGGGTNTISRTTLLAALKQGPLKAYLTGLSTAQWAAIHDDPKLQVTPYLHDSTVAAAVSVDFVTVFQVSINVSGNFIATVEIRFVPSAVR